MTLNTIHQEANSLLQWYHQQKRDLPWRQNKDPYRVWISEIMLQQTTVAAVIPYYQKFLKLFPHVRALAAAKEGDVLAAWSGLGYYSRARNLHKAAKILQQSGFPHRASDLEELPGFGPYTSRAVASISFDEQVGVLDGNVIRVLCRLRGLDVPWWQPHFKNILQQEADQLAQSCQTPGDLNQGLMELGATVCTPLQPACVICPWQKNCISFAKDLVAQIPQKKPRKKMQIWEWQPILQLKNGRIALIENKTGPVLKNQWIPPGPFVLRKKKPEKFDFQHTITHHQIFVNIQKKASVTKHVRWVRKSDIQNISPMKIIQKVIDANDPQPRKRKTK